jgi:hypothetical protein
MYAFPADSYWNETVRLSNGKSATIACLWVDESERYVGLAKVSVETAPGANLQVGVINGPVLLSEARRRGASLANAWYEKQGE